jgi:hypothetical protein
LRRDVARGEVEAAVEVARLGPVDELGDDLTSPDLVELIDHDAAGATQHRRDAKPLRRTDGSP